MNDTPTYSERRLIARAIGDQTLIYEADAYFYLSDEGLSRLAAEGRHIELFLAKTYTKSFPRTN